MRLAGAGAAPCPLAWAGVHIGLAGLRPGLCPHPFRGRNGLGSSCLPGLIRGPLGAPTNGLSLGWGDSLVGLRRGTSMERLWSLLQRTVRPLGVRGTSPGPSALSQPLKPAPPLPTSISSLACLLGPSPLPVLVWHHKDPIIARFLPIPQASFPNLMPTVPPTAKVVPTTLSDHLQACRRHPAVAP